jgi:nucleoside-diphosphate-sugar epimerase
MLGRHLIPLLEAEGIDVLPILGRQQLDLLDPGNFDALPACSHVIHLAALNGVHHAWQDPERVLLENLTGTINLLGWARKHGVKRFIFASSYVYGHPQYLPVDEGHPIKPANTYAASKWMGEQLCLEYTRWGMDALALRFFNLIGPAQDAEFLVPTIVEQLRTSTELRLMSSAPKRDYLDVEDAARACLRALTCSLDEPFLAINVGSGSSHSVADIVNELMNLSGRDLPIRYSESHRPNEVHDVVADITRAKRVLRWKPQVSIQESLQRVWREAQER